MENFSQNKLPNFIQKSELKGLNSFLVSLNKFISQLNMGRNFYIDENNGKLIPSNKKDEYQRKNPEFSLNGCLFVSSYGSNSFGVQRCGSVMNSSYTFQKSKKANDKGRYQYAIHLTSNEPFFLFSGDSNLNSIADCSLHTKGDNTQFRETLYKGFVSLVQNANKIFKEKSGFGGRQGVTTRTQKKLGTIIKED